MKTTKGKIIHVSFITFFVILLVIPSISKNLNPFEISSCDPCEGLSDCTNTACDTFDWTCESACENCTEICKLQISLGISPTPCFVKSAFFLQKKNNGQILIDEKTGGVLDANNEHEYKSGYWYREVDISPCLTDPDIENYALNGIEFNLLVCKEEQYCAIQPYALFRPSSSLIAKIASGSGFIVQNCIAALFLDLEPEDLAFVVCNNCCE